MSLQSFEGLQKDGHLYVDKTGFVYKLVNEGKPTFLSRPHRCGKSLLMNRLRLRLQDPPACRLGGMLAANEDRGRLEGRPLRVPGARRNRSNQPLGNKNREN